MKKMMILGAVVGALAAGGGRAVAGGQDGRTGATAVQVQQVQPAKQVKQDTLHDVQGSCGMCKTRVEKCARGIDGVTSASWDQKSKRLALTYDPARTSTEAVARALARVGHDAGKERAADAVYDALPGCCKYRKGVTASPGDKH
jgi:Cu(I)/Ag(I) efflux system membrane fusion protein